MVAHPRAAALAGIVNGEFHMISFKMYGDATGVVGVGIVETKSKEFSSHFNLIV